MVCTLYKFADRLTSYHSTPVRNSRNILAVHLVGPGGTAVGLHLAVLLDVENGGASDALLGGADVVSGVLEGDRAEVGKGDERAVLLVVLQKRHNLWSAWFYKQDNAWSISDATRKRGREAYLDDPLGVLTAQAANVAHVGESLGDGLAGGQVLEHGRAGHVAGRVHSRLDLLAGADVEALESVGVVRVPLVPAGEGGLCTLDDEFDTGLQDG